LLGSRFRYFEFLPMLGTIKITETDQLDYDVEISGRRGSESALMLNPTLTYAAANALATRTPTYAVENSPGLREEILKDSPSLFLELGEESGPSLRMRPAMGWTAPIRRLQRWRARSLRQRPGNRVLFNGTTQYVSIADNSCLILRICNRARHGCARESSAAR
jgi:hypothetical protein